MLIKTWCSWNITQNNIITNKQLCSAISCTLLFCRYIYIYWGVLNCRYIYIYCFFFRLSLNSLCLSTNSFSALPLTSTLSLNYATICVSSKVITVVWYIYIASMLTAYACYTLVVHKPMTTVLHRVLFCAMFSRSCHI